MFLHQVRTVAMISSRSFKNFGHKRQPLPAVTVLWHGTLTFTFLGMCLNWERIGTWVFGEDTSKKSKSNWDVEQSRESQ